MELKLEVTAVLCVKSLGLNRTIMELKCTSFRRASGSCASLNRTIMELKFYSHIANSLIAIVLIVPLWN